MKELLELTGALLYIAFSIVVFPLLVLAHCFIELFAAIKYVKAHRKQWKRYWKKKRQAYHLPQSVHVAISRVKNFHL